MNHREVAKRVLRIATGAEPTEDQVDRLVDARKDGLRMRFVTVDWARSETSSEEFCKSVVDDPPFRVGDVVECVDNSACADRALQIGKRYEVWDVAPDGQRISVLRPGLDTPGWRASRFRLVSRWEGLHRSPTSSESS